MKKYTQEEFNTFPVIDGIRHCPTGDYSNIYIFGEQCSFGAGCSFGELCSFDEWCFFGTQCYFGDGCTFGSRCHFGEKCSFGAGCSFGVGCSFGAWGFFAMQCSFGGWCSFGAECRFGAGCRCEFGEFTHLYTFGGFGRRLRTTYAFLLTDGMVGIRSGCFRGNLKDFREIIHRTHAGTAHEKLYNGVADLIELCMEERK